MSSAAAHWSPAVTELVQLVRTRWRDNCFVGTKKRFQLCFETRGPRQMSGICCFAPNICSSLPMMASVYPGPAAYWQFSRLLHFEPAARVG